MTRPRLRVLDGGLATELARAGHDLSDALWSARLLLDAPQAIGAVHDAYFRAGADVATTATYQASYEGFATRGLTADETTEVLRRAVAIAIESRARAQASAGPLLVAASIGPYGATRHDGSEYTGDYGLSEEALVDFHRRRFSVLARAGADLLACETIPSRLEARALVRLLREHAHAAAWVTFSCRDDAHTSAGDAIGDCVALLEAVPQVVGVGVNCVAPHLVRSLVGRIAAATSKPIVVYPNSGERWDAVRRQWVGAAGSFTALVPEWISAGAAWIGGCCRTTPADIRAVRAHVDARHAAGPEAAERGDRGATIRC